MSVEPGATARLGVFIAQAASKELSDEVKRKAAYCLLDALGLAILAHNERNCSMYRQLLNPTVGTNTARVWSDGLRVPLTDAVTANAIAVHAQFHDDTDYSSWTHPGSLITPAAVTLGDSEDATLGAILRAIVVGYNTIEWLGARDVVARGLIDRGIRTSPTLGTVGAAAAAAALLGLNQEQATSAIGIASSIAGGVLEPVRCGSDEWRIQNAHAARGGLLAAQLARQGMRGAPQGLEGPKGLLRALAGIEEVPGAWAEDPDSNAILESVAKPWATLGDNMSAVLAAGLIHDRAAQLDAGTVRRITIKIWRHFTEYPGTAYRGPFERVPQALASMAFATATMLVYGELEYDKPLNHRDDPAVLALLPLIEIIPDDGGNPFDATVEVSLQNGHTIRAEAGEADQRLLQHDRETAINLFEKRLCRSDYSAGTGSRIATLIMDAVATNGTANSTKISPILGMLARQAH